jgi:hypothetical protein
MRQTAGDSNDKVPVWMAALGVKEGGWFIDSKVRAKRAMTSKCFSPAARIHICLGLATMGFQRELAVKMVGGKIVPKTPADVCAETHIKRENFRRHMAELEAIGLGECRGSTKGHVELYSWLVPRPPDVEKIVIAREGNFSGYPPDLVPLLRHYRIRLPEANVIARDEVLELQRRARATIEAERSLRAYANGLQARAGRNKEESNGKEPLKVTGPPPPVNDSDTVEPPPAKAEDDEVRPLSIEPSLYARFKNAYPQQRFDEAKAQPLFEKLNLTEQDLVLQRLPVFLGCERWQQTPQYIPFASTWLKERQYGCDPPPFFSMAADSSSEPVLSRKDVEGRSRVQRIADQLRKEKGR